MFAVKGKGKGGKKEKEDRKEKVDQKENGQIQVTRGTIRGTILGTSRIGTARRMVLRSIRGRLWNLFPISVQSV